MKSPYCGILNVTSFPNVGLPSGFTDEYSKTPDCQKYLLELHNNTLDYDVIKN